MKKRLVALGMAFLMAMSTCMTAFAGYWYLEDGRWEYRDDSGARVRNTLKKSGSHYWWLGPDGYLRTGHAGEKVLIGNAAFMLHNDGRIDRIGEDASGGKVDLFDLIGDKETPRRFDTWDFYETAKDGSAYETWCYWDEEGNKLGGLQEIQGFKYYFDKDNEIKLKKKGTIVDKHYIMGDYSAAIDRWIPRNGKWYYFDENGEQVLGKKTIQGTEYDFGTDGFVDASQVEFPEIASVEIDNSQKEAFVGDVVEIPFKIEVKEASPSNATKEADYDMFKNAYDVSHTYRVNRGVMVPKYEVGRSQLKYEIETKYEIDWEDQLIRIPIDCMGAVFGNMRIGNTKSEDFGIVCRYPESQSMESRIEDLFKDEQEGDALVAGLKTLSETEADSVKQSLVESAEVQTKVQALELMHNGSKKVDTYIDVDDSLGFADKDTCSVIGLGLSMEKEGKIGLKIGTSNEKLPEELTKEKTAVAFDLKVLKNGASTKKLDVPALITISKPDSIKTDDFQLYHMNAGEAEEVNYVEEDGLVTFAAEQFSTFVFVEDAEDTDSGSSGGGSTSSYGPGRWDTGTAGNKGPEDTKTQKPAGTWVQDEKGWWLKYEDGTWPASRWIEMTWNHVPSWYYFNAEGYMATGWMKDGDRWYYLDPSTDGSQGRMFTGWHEIGGKWYFFHETADGPMGSLLVNGRTPDGYQTDMDGVWIQ